MTEETVKVSKKELDSYKRGYRNDRYTYGLMVGGIIPIFTYSMILKPLNLGNLVNPYIMPATIAGCLAGLGIQYYRINYKGEQ